MKQKIVIMVSMPCGKCRAKAMELAARTTGVISVAITGDYADRLEVIGDGVDLVCLVSCLRKKVGRAVILQVEPQVKDKKPEEETKPAEKKSEEKTKPAEKTKEKTPQVPAHPLPQCYPGCYHCPPASQTMVVYDEPAACSIM
ncbi:heavy metal-associated isoprenylated plant protein 16-like isoform X2 [Lolium rigidum]|uniref:heavy metal-associated isoprenylated plant protein 16-like isoform X2 n=1 Tax=Lolium rigidum TaxID=89674 RepID=UPI001F5D73DC|nr:heavy metal-associated isoprenylated plant protein 16-like isoform X2 [Lolium rigidum]